MKEEKAVVISSCVTQKRFTICTLPYSAPSLLLPGTVLAALLLLALRWKVVKAEALATGRKKG
ncbi:MAG: hypothetical protein MPK62_13705 [Alphaproteobacteria bacterium]|nr:hypothetical protein [Alphaproteobacteria bacterium]